MEPNLCPVCGAGPEVTDGDAFGLPSMISCPTKEWSRQGVEIAHHLVVSAPTLEEAVRAWNALGRAGP